MERHDTIKSIVAKLKYLRNLPVDEMATGLEEIQLKLIDMRDRSIEAVRAAGSDVRSRQFLHQTNLLLSIIFGLEYPITDFQRNKMDLALKVLADLDRERAAA